MTKIVIIVLAFACVGLIGHTDRQTAILEKAADNCAYQNDNTTPTLQQCLNNQLEVNNDK